jgi:hypothetical protein
MGVMARRVLGALLASIVIVAAVATLSYRSTYGTWWQTPQRVGYCERTYLRGTSALTRAEIDKSANQTAVPGDASYPFVTVSRVPPVVGQQLVAAVTPKAACQRLGLPCAMEVYLKTGADAYAACGLSGGS